MPTVLESLLDPISRLEFRERYYGKQPLLIRGHAGKFAGLFTWDDLNRLLNASSYPRENVDIAGVGGSSHATSPWSLIEQCRGGASLIFTQLQLFEPKVGELVRALEAETGETMVATLILSQPSQAAFARHYDRQDAIALQLDGHKAWEVYEATVDKPLVDVYDAEPPRRLLLECELAPGDVLYVPRGYWHQALAQRGMSVHLTFGVNPRTGIDFLTWLVNELRSDVRFRHELPPSFAEDPEELRKERLREHVDKLGEILRSRLAEAETIRSFDQSRVLADRDTLRFKFPAQLLKAPGTELGVKHFSRPASQRYVLKDGPTADRMTLSVWGHTFHFPRTARPLVEFIVSQTAFTAEDARAHAGELAEKDVWEVLDPLLREGILDVADGPSGSR